CSRSRSRPSEPDEWENYVTRQARWVDFENGYKSMDQDYMESVMWAFKELYDKGLIYQGFRVLPYSWAEHTPLSNQETRLDDSYRDRQDPTVTVTMPFTGAREGYPATKTWEAHPELDRKSTRLNSSHVSISYAVFCLKK